MNYTLLSSCNYGSDSNCSNRFKMIYAMHEVFLKQSLRIWTSPFFPEYEVTVTLADGCNCLLPEIRILNLSVPSWSNVGALTAYFPEGKM